MDRDVRAPGKVGRTPVQGSVAENRVLVRMTTETKRSIHRAYMQAYNTGRVAEHSAWGEILPRTNRRTSLLTVLKCSLDQHGTKCRIASIVKATGLHFLKVKTGPPAEART